jgi:hypothetical protein
MSRNKDIFKRPQISVQTLALVVEAVHKDWLFELQQNSSALHAFIDILMVTREVVYSNKCVV